MPAHRGPDLRKWEDLSHELAPIEAHPGRVVHHEVERGVAAARRPRRARLLNAGEEVDHRELPDQRVARPGRDLIVAGERAVAAEAIEGERRRRVAQDQEPQGVRDHHVVAAGREAVRDVERVVALQEHEGAHPTEGSDQQRQGRQERGRPEEPDDVWGRAAEEAHHVVLVDVLHAAVEAIHPEDVDESGGSDGEQAVEDRERDRDAEDREARPLLPSGGEVDHEAPEAPHRSGSRSMMSSRSKRELW